MLQETKRHIQQEHPLVPWLENEGGDCEMHRTSTATHQAGVYVVHLKPSLSKHVQNLEENKHL